MHHIGRDSQNSLHHLPYNRPAGHIYFLYACQAVGACRSDIKEQDGFLQLECVLYQSGMRVVIVKALLRREDG